MTEPDGAGSVSDVASRIAGARRILLACHLGPDGDAVGSLSALAVLLRAHGRDVTLYNPDPIPRSLRFLPEVGTFVHKLLGACGVARGGTTPPAPFDLTVVVDCADRKLLGERFPGPELTGPLVVIDHHASGRPFGDVSWCDPGAASVGVLVARLAEALGWELPEAAGAGLYTSLVADTGSFRYANTNPEALRLAATLIETCHVSPWRIASELGERAPLARWKLLSAALSTLELELGGRVAVLSVTDQMVRAAGAAWEDTEGLVNYARGTEGVEVGVLLSPCRDKGVRVSLRSKGLVDAGALCLPLGGGGHPGAGGCHLPGTLAEARATVVAAIAAALEPTALIVAARG